MSPVLISRSPDLKQLRDEGYDISVENTYLLVNHVPYVNDQRQVAYGILISTLVLAGDRTAKPDNHVALWTGSFPCDSKGVRISTLVNEQNKNEKIHEGLIATFSFSQKPIPAGYNDYYEKMTTYVRILEGHAHAIDPNATARTFLVTKPEEERSVFCYMDTASSRAGVSAANVKLKNGKIAIVGLGGTGAYVLDLLAKTPVNEIHLFDGDLFLQHNAFRSPGAPSIEDLEKRVRKVEWFAEIYSKMRHNIFPHAHLVDEETVGDLGDMNFVFLCMEGAKKKTIVDFLTERKIPFIDVGIGMYNDNDVLGGNAQVTTCTLDFHGHISKRIGFSDEGNNEYSHNIQIADINALNAALAVIKWKKLSGFYFDAEKEYNTTYGIITNVITNDDHHEETKENQT